MSGQDKKDKPKPKTMLTEQDQCGPEPPRPNYYSPQAVRDRWNEWQLCKAGVNS